MRHCFPRLASVCAALATVACGADDGGGSAPAARVTPAPPGAPWESLDEWNLFDDAAEQRPAARVVPFDVISPLFSDYTAKSRFLWVPDGEVIGYDDVEKWAFPVGTILVKTFAYLDDRRDASRGRRLLETRLLVHDAQGAWSAHTYVWNAGQTRAVKTVAGDTLDVSWIHDDGSERSNAYGVPNTNQCQECHGQKGTMDTLGGRTRQLDRDFDYGSGGENQLEHLDALGLLDRRPAPAEARTRLVDPLGAAPLDERVRSYFDANCGHCHSPDRFAGSSGLYIDLEHTDFVTGNPSHWGVCKAPTSAGGATCGLSFDVVPGSPDQSILHCRVASDEPKVRMPPLASRLPDEAGAALIAEWIRGLSPAGCQ